MIWIVSFFFLALKNHPSIWLIQNMLIVKFYHAILYRKIISLYPKLFFKNQGHNFKYVHITSKSLQSGSQSREIISGGFVTVPFSQSLTLDLGTVASSSRSNSLWVWHDHVSGELVKVHSSTGLVPALCFYGGCRRHAVLWHKLWVVQTDDTWSRVCFASMKLSHQKLGSSWNWQSEAIPDQHFVSCGCSSF